MTVARAIRHHPFLAAAFGLALALTLFFAVRLVLFGIFWADPAHRDVPIEGWMSPGFVAHSWHLPPEVVGETLGLTPEKDGRRRTLEEIAQERGVPVESLITALETAIETFRARQP